ncbi:MAG TPA: hypothetical protein VGK89_05850 [Candidatus Eisenbacteria bacterium]
MDAITLDSPSVQSYLSILQGVINRMASNCAGCKTWCVGLVSAIIVIIADKREPEYVWLSLVPITLFFCLDAYYLALERSFCDRYNTFIRKLHSATATVDDLFIVSPGADGKQVFTATVRAIASIAIWPFYGLLALMLLLIRVWVL